MSVGHPVCYQLFQWRAPCHRERQTAASGRGLRGVHAVCLQCRGSSRSGSSPGVWAEEHFALW